MGMDPPEEPWKIDQRIGQRVLDRLPRDMSQAALSKATGIPESTLSRYLHPQESTGRYRGTPASALLMIARALGVTICDLYGVEEHPQRGQFAADQPGRIRDMVVQQLMASHNQLPEAEKQFVEDVAAAADALRQRLRREEGLGSSPTPQR